MLADALQVGDQIRQSVMLGAGVGAAAPGAALVEHHDAVALRVEQPPQQRRAAAAGAAVQGHHRLTVRVAALLHIQQMVVAHIQVLAMVGLDWGE